MSDAPSPPGAAVNAGTRIRLHDLALRADGDEWLVGRMDTRSFVALPATGKRAIDLLRRGMSAAEVAGSVRRELGSDVDVPDFIRALIVLDFVAEVDGQPVPGPRPLPATFPRLRPKHVRFVLNPVIPVLVGALIVIAVLTLLRRSDLSFSYRTLLWSPHGSLVIGFGAVAGWALLLLHEFAHLVVARATGVHGRIRLGTRLQFLVMQTDISGIELAPRRHRMTAYLAGIAVNLTVASLVLLLATTTDPGTTAHRLLSALTLLAVLPLPFEFMVFMRTDVYFVLQDLTNCRDLYGDGVAYARYAVRRIARAFGYRGSLPADPSLRLSGRERRVVRGYSVVLAVGTLASLAFLGAITLPADFTLLRRSAASLGSGRTVLENLDAATALIVLGGIHVLWMVTRWRKSRRAS